MPDLVDTSVWKRKDEPDIAKWFQPRLIVGQVGITELIALELLHTAADSTDYAILSTALAALPHAPVGDAEWRRANEVMQKLAARRPPVHTSVSPAALAIAAAAEHAGWTLVHDDSEFELIAEVTRQPMTMLRLRRR